ncbi:MAG TPA: Crp/Fnr family transcriptional regulator [Allosphingosinicella sp.]|nr:Crp/Fnr family transcriptional regulator [Allosphingosinicella sp.]
MPRYFFNIRNGNGLTEDEEGRDFPDVRAARAEALKGVRSIVAEEVKEGRLDLAGRVEITDESGASIEDIPFGDALAAGGGTGGQPLPRRAPRPGASEIGAVVAHRLSQIGEIDAEDEAALLTLEGQVRDVPRGEDLLVEGEERPTTSVVVVSGLLQRYNISAEGRRQIHSFYIAGDTPCMETLHLDYMDNTLGAAAPSRIGIVPHAELHRVMEERPKVRALIWRETLVQAAIFRLWLMRNSQMLAHSALAHFFCEMLARARSAGLSDGTVMDLPLTQEDVADALGMTSVHVNRTLSLLRTGDLADFRGGKLRVADPVRLAEVGEFDPRYLHLRR